MQAKGMGLLVKGPGVAIETSHVALVATAIDSRVTVQQFCIVPSLGNTDSVMTVEVGSEVADKD
jgi:hypothetical protein